MEEKKEKRAKEILRIAYYTLGFAMGAAFVYCVKKES